MANETPPTTIPSYTPKDLLISDYLRVEQVKVIPNQGASDLVEVRAGTSADGSNHLWKSLRYHVHQSFAPSAGEIIEVVAIRRISPSIATDAIPDDVVSS